MLERLNCARAFERERESENREKMRSEEVLEQKNQFAERRELGRMKPRSRLESAQSHAQICAPGAINCEEIIRANVKRIVKPKIENSRNNFKIIYRLPMVRRDRPRRECRMPGSVKVGQRRVNLGWETIHIS